MPENTRVRAVDRRTPRVGVTYPGKCSAHVRRAATMAAQANKRLLAAGPNLPIQTQEVPAMRRKPMHSSTTLARFVTEYARQGKDDSQDEGGNVFEIPDDLTTLSDEELAQLNEQAITNFDSVYGDGQELASDDVEVLEQLTSGIEALAAEIQTRQEAADERSQAAAQLASRVHPVEEDEADDEADEDSSEGDEDDTDGESDSADGQDDSAETGDEKPEAAADETDAADQPEAIAASGAGSRGRGVRVSMNRARRRRLPRQSEQVAPSTIRDVLTASSDVGGYANGAGIDWNGVSQIIQHRLRGFPEQQYASAARAGKHLHAQHSLAMIRKSYSPELTISGDSFEQVEKVLDYATNEARLSGGSLTASGGWCAPSETVYDLLELESSDGLLSLPEVNLARGGLRYTRGPQFSDFYGEGFHYTEDEDKAGNYDGDNGGTKPCFRVPCPEWEETRLELDGLCLEAGLLQQRGFPELTARTSRGAVVAHDHYVSHQLITAMAAGSDAVTMPERQGAVTPILDAIELQIEHAKYQQRMSRSTTLEGVFPFWVHGAMRADLAKRAGSLDFVNVTDAQINAWFASRGVNPQWVYDYQPLTGTAADFKTWPSTLEFLLYPAGTWVRGNSDVITLDMVYDTEHAATNDFTVLFTEEGFAAIKRGLDSRKVTVSICPDGTTAAAIDFDCDGSTLAAG